MSAPAPPAPSSPIDLLRFTTAGSVDDGKSTLIGRLLWECRALCEDHVRAAQGDTRQDLGEAVDFSLFTDGLAAEREQGITIDVAYRYFATPRRRFIIADTPGHEQYTRNMVTGASTADLAVVLIDASKGITTQSRRHAFITSLLGIPHLLVAVNKMDLVDWSREAFDALRSEFDAFARKLSINDMSFIPLSALRGDNVVDKSERMSWYEGGTLLWHLENTYLGGDRNLIDLRLPVQSVIRPDWSYRGYTGMVESGVVRKGDEIVVLPSGLATRVRSLGTFDGELEQAGPGQSITVCLEDEIDVGRGDVIVHQRNVPSVLRELDAVLIWMHEDALASDTPYLLRHGTAEVRAQVKDIHFRIDPNTLSREDAETLRLNEIGRTVLELYQPIACDDYTRNRRTGSFVLIDPATNATVASGLIMERGRREPAFRDKTSQPGRNLTRTAGKIAVEDREQLLGQRGRTIWLTGLSGSGKSTVAYAVERLLHDRGRLCCVLDGDNVRHGLNRDLGFAPHERKENIRRVAEVCALMNAAGVIVISAFISPFREDREDAREIIGEDRFVETFVDASLETCEARDPKGLYAKARAGDIPDMTGIGSPYEPPDAATIHVPTSDLSPDEAAQRVIDWLDANA